MAVRKPKPLLVADAALSGDRRATLEAMRDRLARDMDDAPVNVVAQIAGRLSAVLLELDEMPAKEKSRSDELAQRRADRLAKAQPRKPATRSG